MKSDWKFDQPTNAEAVTSVHITQQNKPILLVSHYSEDHDWAFLPGGPITMEETQLITMEQIVDIDPTVMEIASLDPGWSAERKAVGEEWVKYEMMKYKYLTRKSTTFAPAHSDAQNARPVITRYIAKI